MALTKVTGDFIKDGVLTQAHLHSSHGITSSHIGEGDKLFFTNARARGAISVSGNALSYNSSTGVITSNFEESPTFSGNVVINGSGSSGNAINITRGSDGTTALRVQNSGEVVTQANYFYASASGVSMYVQNTAVFRGSIMNDTSGAAVRIGDALTIDDDLTVTGGGITLGGTGRIQGIDTVSAGTDAANKTYVDNQVAGIVDSAPSTLDTLNELAAALGDDANFSTTVTNSIATKLPLAGGTLSGFIQLNANELRFDQSGTRSWNVSASGGNLNINSGDSLGNVAISSGLTVADDATFPTVQISSGSSYNENIRMFPGSNGYSSLILGAVAGTSGTGAGQWSLVRFPNSSSNKFTIRHNSTDHVTITTAGNATFAGTVTWSGGSSTNANTAYGWGNHASAGYLTSFTETNGFLGDGGNASTHPGTSRLIYSGQVSAGSGVLGMPTSNNANAFINLNKHSGEYNSQLGFSSDGNIYYRNFNNAAINNSTAFRKIWDSGNDGSGSGLDADLLDGQHASAFASSSHTHAASDITSGNLAAARNTVNLANVASSSDASGVYFRSANEVISGEGWATAQYAYNHNDGFLFLNRNSSSTAFPTFHIGGWNNAGYAGYSDADGLLTLTRSDGTKSQGSTYAGTGLSNTSYYTNIIKTTTKTIFRDAQSLHEFTGAVNVKTDKVQIDQDGTYGGTYATVGFGGKANGSNRVFAGTGTNDGLFLASATGRGVYIRVNGGATDNVSFNADGTTTFAGAITWSGGGSANANTAYGWGNHASAGYISSFDITTQTDSKYLRSNADDGFSGNLTSADNGWIKFYATEETDGNDGKIGSGVFDTGLNIVGAQTSAGTGRQIRLWGDVITDSGSIFWNAGNDGSGSGLDADLLDGSHASSFWTKSGSWYGDLGSYSYTREIGLSMTGGSEFVVLSKSGQGSVLVDGHYMAYESANGFFGSYNSAYGNLTGIRATAANTLKVMQLDGGNAILEVTQDARAPIYYDSNDTGYYIDPNSSGTAGKLRGYLLFNDYGAGVVGTYSSYRYQLVFGMGNSYKGALDGTNVTGGYGLWYSHPNAGGVAANLSNHGLMNIVNGSWHASLANSTRASSDMRAPIFYDLADTTYYSDPGGSSLTNNHNIKGTINFPSSGGTTHAASHRPAYAIYQEGGSWSSPFPDLCIAMHTGIKFGANASYNGMRFYNDYGMATQVMSINNHADGLGSNHVYVNNSLQAGGGLYAPIFYDSNNTAYYTRPSTSSLINTLYTAGTIQAGTSGTGNIYLGNNGGNGTGNHFRFHTNNSSTYFDGNCGDIHWRQGSSTRFIFYMTTANMTVNGTVTQNSDERIKENIITIDGALDKVNKLRGVYYNRTDINTSQKQIGLIAQEVETVIPEVVLTANDELKTKSISYAQINALLIEAIKEQQVIINDLKTRLETLENQ